jgi:hypothetical protein
MPSPSVASTDPDVDTAGLVKKGFKGIRKLIRTPMPKWPSGGDPPREALEIYKMVVDLTNTLVDASMTTAAQFESWIKAVESAEVSLPRRSAPPSKLTSHPGGVL